MKNSNHASKALAVVLSGALAFAPAANAALDESNMAYTSAAEGFYGSLRVQYANNDADEGIDNDAKVEAEGSRLGVRGDIDIGGGLEAFYGFEWNLGDPANGDKGNLNTRQHHVGLKGDWGSIWLGAFDSVIVRFGGFATTDILDQYSGNFEPRYRTSNAIAYISPDLNGFNFGIEVQANDKALAGPDGVLEDASHTSIDETADNIADDGNDFDTVGIGAGYSIGGLNFSAAYNLEQDSLTNTNGTTDDSGQYALGIGYSQDNWIVAAMFGSKEVKDGQDAPFLSLAAGVSVDKLDVHGLWEIQSAEQTSGVDLDETIAAVTARYHLGSKARLRAGWKNTESTIGNLTRRALGQTEEDQTQYAIGMRVDF